MLPNDSGFASKTRKAEYDQEHKQSIARRTVLIPERSLTGHLANAYSAKFDEALEDEALFVPGICRQVALI
jgi:hypothetical protein